MASEEREFPPSSHRLEQLRKSGVIAFSPDFSVFAALLGAVLSVWLVPAFFLPRMAALFSRMPRPEGEILQNKQLVAIGGSQLLAEQIESVTVLLPTMLFASVAVIAISVLFFGALQTRFLVTSEPLGFNFGRLFSALPFIGMRQRALPALFRAALAAVSVGLVTVILSAFVVDHFVQFQDGLAAPSLTPQSRLGAGLDLLLSASRQLFMPIAAAVFFVGVLSRLAIEILFRRAHRMSRAEVEAEARETEPSPQFRQARQIHQQSSELE